MAKLLCVYPPVCAAHPRATLVRRQSAQRCRWRKRIHLLSRRCIEVTVCLISSKRRPGIVGNSLRIILRSMPQS
ncbi:hypothetical protein MPTK2_4g04170 [Marchantia polymorpha subsp. ruderalis]